MSTKSLRAKGAVTKSAACAGAGARHCEAGTALGAVACDADADPSDVGVGMASGDMMLDMTSGHVTLRLDVPSDMPSDVPSDMPPDAPSDATPNHVASSDASDTDDTDDEDVIHWSASQQHVIDLVFQGRNVVVTGAAGCGKSAVVEYLVAELVRRGFKVAVTATTGIAALNVGGKTLHSFLRVGPGIDRMTKEEVAREAMARRGFAQELKTYRVLIVDEVSMLDPDFLEKIDYMLRMVRSDWRPMGGLQVVFVGDFAQLPPVRKASEAPMSSGMSQLLGMKRGRVEGDDAASTVAPAAAAVTKSRFIFGQDLFYELFDDVVDLKQVFRQSDPTFIRMLNDLRFGRMTPEYLSILQSRVGSRETLDLGESKDGIEATRLYAKNMDVDSINAAELVKIKSASVYFTMRTGFHVCLGRTHKRDKEAAEKVLNFMVDKLKKDLNAPERLELKEGAQVYLTYNLDTPGGLVNGSRGVVIGFSGKPDSCDLSAEDAKRVGDDELRQFAIVTRGVMEKTGASEDEIAAQIRYGEPEVRERAIANEVARRRRKAKKVKADPESKFHAMGKALEEPLVYPAERMPIVRFQGRHGKTRTIEIPYVKWAREERGVGEAYVWQLPLKLGWCSTIHSTCTRARVCVGSRVLSFIVRWARHRAESQGLSLDRAELCLDSSIFSPSQAYVALSRVRSLEGLRITVLRPDVFYTDAEVIAFYERPYASQRAEWNAKRKAAVGLSVMSGGAAKALVTKKRV